MKNVSKIALAVFAAVGLAACSSNNGSSVEHFATYSKTEQGKKDVAALKANTANPVTEKTVQNVTDVKQNDVLITGSQTGAGHNQYAQFGVFRTGLTKEDEIGGVRYAAVVTPENKLDAAKALAALSAKDEKGGYKEDISAEYTGKLAYSAKEKGKDGKEHLEVRVANLTLNLHNDKIGGEAKDDGKKRDFIFEAANIYNNGGELAYSGKLTVVTGDKVVDEKTEVGSYHGFFAGATAPAGDQGKEVYTKDTVKDALAETAGKIDTPSFHGAFDGKK